MTTNFRSSHNMLDWQYRTLLGELQQIELHASSGDCPRILRDPVPAEFCLAKHSLNVAVLAAETANMDPSQSKLLQELSNEAHEKHNEVKDYIRRKGELPELAIWARTYRKKLEPVYYARPLKAFIQQFRTASILDNFSITLRVANPFRGTDMSQLRWHEFDCLVDTGMADIGLPQEAIESMGLQSWGKQAMQGIDEQSEEDVYPVIVEYQGTKAPSMAIASSTPIVGTLALRLLGLKVDPVNRRLEPAPFYC